MERENCIEALKKQGFKVEENQSGIIYCYECEDFEIFRDAVLSLGYTRSFGATPHTKEDIRR